MANIIFANIFLFLFAFIGMGIGMVTNFKYGNPPKWPVFILVWIAGLIVSTMI